MDWTVVIVTQWKAPPPPLISMVKPFVFGLVISCPCFPRMPSVYLAETWCYVLTGHPFCFPQSWSLRCASPAGGSRELNLATCCWQHQLQACHLISVAGEHLLFKDSAWLWLTAQTTFVCAVSSFCCQKPCGLFVLELRSLNALAPLPQASASRASPTGRCRTASSSTRMRTNRISSWPACQIRRLCR